MMLQTSYGIWILIVGFLMIGLWVVKRRVAANRKVRGKEPRHKSIVAPMPSSRVNHDVEHRELLSLMVRQTDSVLNGLSQAIQQERSKLNALVNSLPMSRSVVTSPSERETFSENSTTSHDRIIPMARSGETVSTIAQQLKLPEAEVSMVIRMNAA